MSTETVEKHQHVWQPNGVAQIDCVSHSPVSTWDDWLYTSVYSLAVCACGVTKRTKVGERNGRRRGDRR